MSIPQPLVSTKDAAKYVGLSEVYLRQLRMEGKRRNRITPPPYYRVGRKILYSTADLDNWLDQHRVDPTAEPAA